MSYIGLMTKLNIFFCNSLDLHYQQLKVKLFGKETTPFKRRFVVVYGPAMQSWLILKMAQDPEIGIATGIEFIYLNQAFDELLKLSGHRELHCPTALELTLAIENQIHLIIKNYVHLSRKEQEEWSFLLNYLKIHMTSLPLRLTAKMEKRVVGLSQHLAALFKDYGRYGKKLLDRWSLGREGEWQSQLWKALFNDETGWTASVYALEKPTIALENGEIHFFSISFLPNKEFDFLQKLAKSTPIFYYLLSPCALFWSDILSDKESGYIHAFWQQKGKGETQEALQLEEYLRDRNPLLANFRKTWSGNGNAD